MKSRRLFFTRTPGEYSSWIESQVLKKAQGSLREMGIGYYLARTEKTLEKPKG